MVYPHTPHHHHHLQKQQQYHDDDGTASDGGDSSSSSGSSGGSKEERAAYAEMDRQVRLDWWMCVDGWVDFGGGYVCVLLIDACVCPAQHDRHTIKHNTTPHAHHHDSGRCWWGWRRRRPHSTAARRCSSCRCLRHVYLFVHLCGVCWGGRM